MNKGRAANPSIVLAVTSAATFLAYLDATVVAIAFPSIRQAFPGAALSDLSWVLNAYTLVFSAAMVPFGRLADLAGRKRFFIAGVAVFTLASGACALTPTAGALVAARAVQGLGAAMMVPTALALILGAFPPERRARAIGLYGASAAVAAATGPALGGLIISVADWRWVFTLNLPAGVLAALAAARVLDESRDERAGRLPDVAGAAVFAAAVGLAALAIVRSPDWGWSSPRVLLLVVSSVALLGLFLARSARHAAPIFELALWRDRSFAVSNFATVLFGMGFFGTLVLNPLFLTGAWHYSVLSAGVSIAPSAIAAAFCASVGGWIAEKRGQTVVILAGAFVFAGSRLWLALAAGPSPDFLGLWLPTALMGGAGVGLAFPSLSSAAVAGLPAGRYATGSALNQVSRQVGSVLGVAVVLTVVSSGTGGLAVFRTAFEFAAALTVASAVAALGLGIRPAAAAREVAAVTQVPSIRPAEAAVVGEARNFVADAGSRSVPIFVYRSPVHFDELDAMKMLHNSRFFLHMERAFIAFCSANGLRWTPDVGQNPDQFQVVRETWLEYLQPFVGVGDLVVEVGVEHLGETSGRYTFTFRSEDGSATYARGWRAVVKVDPESLRPAPWTEAFRKVHEPLLVGSR
jgi:NTE family protein